MASKITFPDCRLVLAVIIAVAFGGASLARSLGLFRHDMYWLQEGLGRAAGRPWAGVPAP